MILQKKNAMEESATRKTPTQKRTHQRRIKGPGTNREYNGAKEQVVNKYSVSFIYT